LASRRSLLARAIRRCPVCDEQYYGSGKACSKKCKEKQRIESGENLRRMRMREAKKAGLTFEEYERRIEEREARRKWPACTVWFPACVQCGRLFTSSRKGRTICSEGCRKRRMSEQMLARYYSDPDNWSTRRKRRRLFERDSWRCRVCGKKVSDQLPRNHPRRAVAMHILAKATGGEWVDDNMATGCHECNVADGVNKIPVQTHLSMD
jgi:hypothetical protein